MGKKGSKRKTRWRTLSIGAPPGEEDEEDGLRNGYVRSRENENASYNLDRNEQGGGYKPRRPGTGSTAGGTGSTSGSTSGYGSSGQRSRREESTGSPSQPKIVFNEDEYTRITTPRQDVLFKKGYLSKKKPWASNASTSATPSTTESQSASHSTADGSETTEDQQLLDRDTGAGEYPAVVEPGAQIGYSTFYDHTSGYYYEYPVMLVGPAPMPAQVGPNVLAAVPCGPVPLRPIEWINPAFVPKLSGQPYCMMDYQTAHGTEVTTIVDGQETASLPVESTNGVCNESGTGSASCSGSVAEETEERTERTEEKATDGTAEGVCDQEVVEEQQEIEMNSTKEHHHEEEPYVETMNIEADGLNGLNGGPYIEPILMQQPVHVSHVSHVSHVVPTMPQPYMYPGHYMFGPPLVNVNGVTLQGGPMIRTTDVTAMAAACAKRRKKKKRRKQRRPALGNTEDDEEEEYSSECDNGLLSSRLSWSVGSSATTTTTTMTTTTATATTATTTANRPLNPECQEFQLRTNAKPVASNLVASENVATSDQITSVNTYDQNNQSILIDPVSRDDNMTYNESNGPLSSKPIDENHEETTESLVQSAESIDRSSSIVDPNQNNDRESETERLICRVVDEKKESEETRSIELGRSADDETNSTSVEVKGETKDEGENRDSINQSANQKCPEHVDKTAINPRESHIENHAENHRENVENHTDKIVSNGEVFSDKKRIDKSRSKDDEARSKSSFENVVPFDDTCRASSTPKINLSNNVEDEESCKSQDQTVTAKSARRKYSGKGAKFVREPTPGPDLEETSSLANEIDKPVLPNSEVKNPDPDSRPENNRSKKDLINSEVISQNEPPELPSDLSRSLENETFEEPSDKPSDEPSETFGNFDNSNDNVNEYNENKIASDAIVECSTEDSGFESQSRTLDYPITKAVTEWLERVNSPDIFISVSSDSEGDEGEEDEEELNERPPKNLQGNPMPALSANSGADKLPRPEASLSRTASCGEFARVNNNVEGRPAREGQQGNPSEETKRTSSRKKKASKSVKRKAAERNLRRGDVDTSSQRRSLPSTDSKPDSNQVSRKQDVGGVCEFTEEDSTAGMRVATSSRMDSKRVNAKRTRKSGNSGRNRESAENVDVKVRRVTDATKTHTENEDDEGIVEDTVSVKTFEKGEIVVSVDGKLLPIASYEPIFYNVVDRISDSIDSVRDIEIQTDECRGNKRNESSDVSEGEDENDSVIASLNSIEEPDVLECWEAETIEPVITPKRMLQTRGISYDGEAAEEDNVGSKSRHVEHVQKYYRLARESTASIEESLSERCRSKDFKESSVSCVVPNECGDRMLESVCTEEIPIVLPNNQVEIKRKEKDEKIPVDEAFEAFEAYESCYTGKTPFLTMDSSIFKPRPFYNRDGEGPIPCRAVCCNIQ